MLNVKLTRQQQKDVLKSTVNLLDHTDRHSTLVHIIDNVLTQKQRMNLLAQLEELAPYEFSIAYNENQ